MPDPKLTVDGEVENPTQFSYDDLAALDPAAQVSDVSKWGLQRGGDAVRLTALLERVRPKPGVKYLTLHAAADDFHASVPLEPIRERGLLVYRLVGGPLPLSAGGPFRFFIRDFAACHTDEVDECANVKFVNHIELSAQRGPDNRPSDDEAHEALHRGEEGAGSR